MKVGIIAPIEKLEEYCITKVHYVLPRVASENSKYLEFYRKKALEKNLVLVDCTEYSWRRKPEDLELLRKVLREFEKGNIMVITPSYMFNWEKTIEVAKEYASSLGGYRYVSCLEGTTISELEKCREELRKISSNYALPSHLGWLREELDLEGKVVWIDNHTRMEETPKLDGALITSLPVRLGLEGRLLEDYLPAPPPLDLYHNNFLWDKMVRKNIWEVVKYYEGT